MRAVRADGQLTARQSNPFYQKGQVFLFIFDIVLAAPGDKNTRLHGLHSELCSEWLPFHDLIGGYVRIRQDTSGYVSMHQHTLAYVSIRQHTYVARVDWRRTVKGEALVLREHRHPAPAPANNLLSCSVC